jgi:hypothetical protein
MLFRESPLIVATKFKVETKVVAIDVSKAEARETGFAKIESLCKTLDVGILGMTFTLLNSV